MFDLFGQFSVMDDYAPETVTRHMDGSVACPLILFVLICTCSIYKLV